MTRVTYINKCGSIENLMKVSAKINVVKKAVYSTATTYGEQLYLASDDFC